MAREVFLVRRQRLRLWRFVAFTGACLATCAPAQTVQIAPQTSVAGDWVTLEIAFRQAANGPLTALQWELEIAAGALDLEDAPLTRAPLVVKDAGKSLSCVVSQESAERLLLPCILAGGQEPIPAGTIVLLSMKVGPKAKAGVARIRLQNAFGVTSELKQVPIEPADGELTIRAR